MYDQLRTNWELARILDPDMHDMGYSNPPDR